MLHKTLTTLLMVNIHASHWVFFYYWRLLKTRKTLLQYFRLIYEFIFIFSLFFSVCNLFTLSTVFCVNVFAIYLLGARTLAIPCNTKRKTWATNLIFFFVTIMKLFNGFVVYFANFSLIFKYSFKKLTFFKFPVR